MESFSKKLEIRWSDLDPNFHVLHSRYYDFGAYCRMAFLTENGFTPAVMMKHHVGPILFREECVYKREITFGDEITVDFKLDVLSSDFRKWTMVHQLTKNDGTLSAIITAEGSWINTIERKVTVPPQEVIDLFNLAPRTETFRMT